MKVISYRITLLEPVLLTALEGDPNQSVSLNYIPGSVLRGAIIGKYMRVNNMKTLDAAQERVRRLFFEGTTRYLNGYPVDREGNRTVPVPLSWHQDKHAVAEQEEGYPAPIYDLAIDEHPDEIKQPRNVKAPFCNQVEDKVLLVSPRRRLSIHTARNRRYGRAIRSSNVAEGSSGAVYRYEALDVDQTFEALIICDYDEDAEFLKEFLKDEEYFLGGSRSAGYGRVRIHDVEPVHEDWREVGGELEKFFENKLVVMFLSDVLLRDDNGQFKADPKVVTDTLKKKLEIELEIEKAFMNSKPVGGFNRKWGLPLPQSLAIGMGSVFVYSLKDCSQLDLRKLKELETKGIGERRVDGFGRLAFNCLTKRSLKVEGKITPDILVPTINDEESKKIAKRLVTRMFERRLEDKLVKEVIKIGNILAGDEKKAVNLPKNAQIYRLRNIIHNALSVKEGPVDVQQVRKYLSNLKERKLAVKQFEKIKIDRLTLLEWIEETLNKVEQERWKRLFNIRENDIPKLGGVEPDIDDSFRIRYILRYIDAVLAHALKKKRKVGN